MVNSQMATTKVATAETDTSRPTTSTVGPMTMMRTTQTRTMGGGTGDGRRKKAEGMEEQTTIMEQMGRQIQIHISNQHLKECLYSKEMARVEISIRMSLTTAKETMRGSLAC